MYERENGKRVRQLGDIRWDKKYKNGPEASFANKARDAGWLVTKCGYPDFICYKGTEVILVEVKAKKHHRLKKSQYKFMNALKQYGIKCYRWSPDCDWNP